MLLIHIQGFKGLARYSRGSHRNRQRRQEVGHRRRHLVYRRDKREAAQRPNAEG